ncbi:MAG: hypothetical protein WC554_06440 [Clostridia bacterium]
MGRQVLCKNCKSKFELVHVQKQQPVVVEKEKNVEYEGVDGSAVFNTVLIIIAAAMIVFSFNMQVTVDSTYNIGLLDQRRAIFLLGCTGVVVGHLQLVIAYLRRICNCLRKK